VEFVKRAGYALMARLAVSDKQADDDQFLALLPLIEQAADDPRNFVKKAVNWALRQIGKRNRRLHPQALACAERIARLDTKSARWIAGDAIRELTDPDTQARIKP
jgi:3-methyladenine DNA glycosylase AlkD